MNIQHIFHYLLIALFGAFFQPSIAAEENSNHAIGTHSTVIEKPVGKQKSRPNKIRVDFCYRWRNLFLAGKTTEPAKPGHNCIPYQATGGGGRG